MSIQTLKLDRAGRITLPKPLLEAVGLSPEAEVVIELTRAGLVIKPKPGLPPLTGSIADMQLPVAEWEQMEREIERGRLT